MRCPLTIRAEVIVNTTEHELKSFEFAAVTRLKLTKGGADNARQKRKIRKDEWRTRLKDTVRGHIVDSLLDDIFVNRVFDGVEGTGTDQAILVQVRLNEVEDF